MGGTLDDEDLVNELNKEKDFEGIIENDNAETKVRDKAISEIEDATTKIEAMDDNSELEDQNKTESVMSNDVTKKESMSEDEISLGEICSEDDDESECDGSVVTFTTLTSVPES